MNLNLINYAIGATAFAGIKNNLNSTVAPTAAADSAAGYSVGSVWINSATNTIYIATSVAPGTANWVTTTGGGGGTTTQNNLVATTAPAISNDSTQGYSVGSHWIDTVTNAVYVCTSAAVGAAVWTFVSNPSNAINNTTAIVPPAATDDLSAGYTVGSIWIDVALGKVYTCVSNILGSAVWPEITNTSTPLLNITAVTDPLITSDLAAGYNIGSYWVNTLTNTSFICLDNTNGSAIWRRFSNKVDNVVGTVPPSLTNDSSMGYEVGSVWLDVPNNDIYMCLDSTVANAKWSLISPEVHNFYNATVAPTGADDITAGYDIGSFWVNSSTQNAYVCTSNLAANAVWIEITKPIVHNLNAIFAPGLADDSVQGYSLGSLWIDTVQNTAYICVDPIATAAKWAMMGSVGAGGGANVAVTTTVQSAVDPTATDDFNAGYKAGSIWINTVTNIAFISVDSAVGAAVWTALSTPASAALFNNTTATTAPTVASDSAAGYAAGSMWIDTVAGNSYICISAAAGAAVWVQTNGTAGALIHNNYAGAVAPSAANASPTYSVGSVWIDLVANRSYLCVDSTTAAAVWVETSPATSLNNNYTATAAPTQFDSAPTYSVGSAWVNVSINKSYLCVNSTATAAIWVETSPVTKTNVSLVSPGVNDSVVAGYTVGSIWVNTVTNTSYICVDNTASAPIWNSIDATVAHNFMSTVDPTSANDNTQGYAVGSMWVNTISNRLFICSSAVTATAAWSTHSIKHNMLATSAPLATNDVSQGYYPSSMWKSTVAGVIDLYVCTDNAAAAAVWLKLTSASEATNNLAATIAPAIANDNTQGYSVSSHWYNVSTKDLYICTSAATGSATWVLVTDQRVNNFVATINPTATNDSSSFYEIGSFWYVASTSTLFVCADATAAAAVWIAVSSILDNTSATTAPAATNDSTQGYNVGSTWIDTVANAVYINVDATATAAIWHQVDGVSLYNLTATVAPTVSNDSSAGYSINSLWFNTVLNDLYVCTSATIGAATWVIVSNEIKNNFAATIAPVVGNDSTQSYEVGSMWIDTVANRIYTCVDSTAGAAIWTEQNPHVLYNLTATVPPTVNADATAGYSINSLWYDAVGYDLYACLDNTAGAAVWHAISNDRLSNFTATAAPLATSDSNLGYSTGSMWVDITNREVYICIDPTATAAIWKQTSHVLNNYAGSGTPTMVSDVNAGYSIGSMWVDILHNDVYFCVVATAGAAIWNKMTSILDKLNGAAAPTAADDSSVGYEIGSVWIDVTNNNSYICADATSNAAVWKQTSPEVLNNYSAILDPTTVADSSKGYSVGSTWVNTSTNTVYICSNATVGAAVWKNPTATSSPSSSFDVINIAATTASGTAITAPTVALGAGSVAFNGNTVVVLLNGFEQVKGTDVSWVSTTTFSLSTAVYVGDVITVKP